MLAIILAIFLVLAAVYIVIGFLLPSRREVAKSYLLPAPPSEVFARILDVSDQPRWRDEIKRVDVIEDGRKWIEVNRQDISITIVVTKLEKDKRIELEFSSDSGLRGRWIGELGALDGGKTRLDVVESIEVDSVIKKPLSYTLFDFEKSVDRYAADLGSSFVSGGGDL